MTNLLAEFSRNGINLDSGWLRSLLSNNPNIGYNEILKNFLTTNISVSSSKNIPELPKDNPNFYELEKDMIVQVDEVVDISQASADRILFKEGPKRTLKFLLNNGKERFIGLEILPLDKENTLMTLGAKILLKKGLKIMYGVAFLTNEVTEYMGGCAPDLIKQRTLIYTGSSA